MENLRKKSLKQQAREVSPVPALLFCELDYDLIDTVRVFALRYKDVMQIKQTLDYKAAFSIGEEEMIFPLSHTNTTSAFTISVARSRILFILRTQAIWSATFNAPFQSVHICQSHRAFCPLPCGPFRHCISCK